MNSTRLNLFADYFQFYLQDESAEGDLSDSWKTKPRIDCWPLRPALGGLKNQAQHV